MQTDENKQPDLPDNVLVIDNPLRKEVSGDDYGYGPESIFPDQQFNATYKINGEQHKVVIQWMGEGKGVAPGYYVFEGEQYTNQPDYPTIDPEVLAQMTEEELRAAYPDDEELNPSEATRVIDYVDSFGWSERGAGKTEHAEAIAKIIEEVFSK